MTARETRPCPECADGYLTRSRSSAFDSYGAEAVADEHPDLAALGERGGNDHSDAEDEGQMDVDRETWETR